MVIRLGKYLRVLGCDVVWDRRLRTHELIGLANREGRIFLTRNGKLAAQYPPVEQVHVLSATDPVVQLREVVAAFGLDVRGALFTRCIRCNVVLMPVADKAQIRARVHPNVYARHAEFFTCPVCGTVFWHGSHVTHTCRKLGLTPPG